MNDHDAKAAVHNRHEPTSSPVELSLPTELAELVLASAIRRTAVVSLWDPASIAQTLNILPRSAAPVLTQVALIHLPHADLDTATKVNDVALLRLMLTWSKQPGGRPIHHTHPMNVGMCSGSTAALDWWLDESGMCFDLDIRCIEAACGRGHAHVLDWWESRGFPRFRDSFDGSMGPAAVAATAGGHVQVLDWIWSRLSPAEGDFGYSIDAPSVLKAAAQSGNVDVLEWWLEKLDLIIPWRKHSVAPILAAAFRHRHLHVLDWCYDRCGEIARHYCYEQEERLLESRDMVLPYAVRYQMLDRVEKLDVRPFLKERWPASCEACCTCNVQALQWLQRRKCLVGSRMQLMKLAANATVVDLECKKIKTLQWIHLNVRMNVVEVFDAKLETDYGRLDLYMSACKDGDVQVLDWLCSKRYALDETKLERYFELASNGEVLDWLCSHTAVSQEWLEEMAFGGCLERATQKSYISVLDWWKQEVLDSVIDLSEEFDQQVELIHADYPVDAIEWWLSPSVRDHVDIRSFPIEDLFKRDKSLDRASVCARHKDCVRLLQAFWDARVPFDVTKCIHAASIGGNLEVLDWFLRVVKAPKAHFIAAFTSLSLDCFGTDPEANHADSLLWWWANIPQVCNPRVDINGGHYRNPMHVHILKTLLKREFVFVL